jgi:hypothetical protein
MADPHLVTALRAKRTEVSNYIHDLEKRVRQMRANLAHIDATIRLLSPDDPEALPPRRGYRRSRYFSAGDLPRLCADALRQAEGGPVTSSAIAEAVIAACGLSADDTTKRHVAESVTAVLRGLKRRGKVVKIGEGRGASWALAKD